MPVGIDVAKAEVVAERPIGERVTVANEERRLRTLVERLARERPQPMEATGGYAVLCAWRWSRVCGGSP